MFSEPKDLIEIEKIFGNVKVDEAGQKLIDHITQVFIETAMTVMVDVPRSAGRTAALRKLWEAKVTCVDTIAKG